MERSEIVSRAFEVFRADVESPPPLTLRGGERVDSYDYPAPYDAGLDEPTDAYIEQFAFHAMPFLDARSWRHYLPRLMDHAFRRPDEPTGLVLQAVIRSLSAPDREPPRLATLSEDQEAVIIAFLEEIARDTSRELEAEPAAQALLDWWAPNARHRPTQAEIEARRQAPPVTMQAHRQIIGIDRLRARASQRVGMAKPWNGGSAHRRNGGRPGTAFDTDAHRYGARCACPDTDFADGP